MNTADFLKFYAEEMHWRMFPVNRLKHPMLDAWPDVATSELNMLNGWLDYWPDMNVAIATGSKSNILAVDVDIKKTDGMKSLKQLFDKYGEFPETPISQTGTGGFHYIFQYPDKHIGNPKLADGIDIRGENGFIMAPPSVHENGNKYVWKLPPSKTAIAMPPRWLVDLLYKPEHKPSPAVGASIPDGERNNTLAQMAGVMRRKGFDEEAIFLAINVENLNKCNPPLPEDEVRAIAASISRYEPSAPPEKKEVPITIRGGHISDTWDEFEVEVKKRAADPREVWGIPYAFPYLSKLTGGKQLGELIILAGEPKVGKSYWALQDTLATAMNDTPCFYWSGEMRSKQIVRRLTSMLGVNARRSRSGFMGQEDWNRMADAKAMLYNIPLYLDDRALALQDVRPLLERMQGQHGIQQAVLDYSSKIFTPGRDEIEKSAKVSDEIKGICNDLNLSVILITSVNKGGMDTNSANASKSNIRGSGQQIHDADVVYLLTQFKPTNDPDENFLIKPDQYDRAVSLHVAAGRELDHELPGGVVQYIREATTPKFKELKKVVPGGPPPNSQE